MINLNEDIISSNKAFSEFITKHLEYEKPWITRRLASLGSVLFIGFYFVDLLSIEENATLLIFFRLLGLVFFAITYYSSTKKDFFNKYYTIIMAINFLGVSWIVMLMLYLSGPGSLANMTYFAGVMIILSALFPLTHLSPKNLFIIAFIIHIMYVYFFFYLSTDHSQSAIITTLNNLFFMFGSVALGFIGDFIRKKQLYYIFNTQHRLKKAYLTGGTTETINISSINNIKDNILIYLNNGYYSRLSIHFVKIEMVSNQDQEETKKLIELSINPSNCNYQCYGNILLASFYTTEDDEESFKSMYEQFHKTSIKQNNIFYCLVGGYSKTKPETVFDTLNINNENKVASNKNILKFKI